RRRAGAMGSMGTTGRRATNTRDLDGRGPVGRGPRAGARGRRRGRDRRAGHEQTPPRPGVAPGAPAPPPGPGLLMRRELDGGYELDDDPDRDHVDAAFPVLKEGA